jgi:twitching motility protein PilU
MAKSRELGMRTFDWALFELYNDGHIGYEEAIRNADSANELRRAIKLKSPRGEPSSSSGFTLSIDAQPTGEELAKQREQELAAQQEKKRQLELERIAEQKLALQKKRELEDQELAALRAANKPREAEAA